MSEEHIQSEITKVSDTIRTLREEISSLIASREVEEKESERAFLANRIVSLENQKLEAMKQLTIIRGGKPTEGNFSCSLLLTDCHLTCA